MIGLIILGLVILIYYGKIKFTKPTNIASENGISKLFILYTIHCGTALGLGIAFPVAALFSVPDLLLLLILSLAILAEFIVSYFYISSKEVE